MLLKNIAPRRSKLKGGGAPPVWKKSKVLLIGASLRDDIKVSKKLSQQIWLNEMVYYGATTTHGGENPY